jgi:hypothetical protein
MDSTEVKGLWTVIPVDCEDRWIYLVCRDQAAYKYIFNSSILGKHIQLFIISIEITQIITKNYEKN